MSAFPKLKMSVSTGSRMRETIHSGHFMVSDFEPESEAQDEEYEVGMPLPPGPDDTVVVKGTTNSTAPPGFGQQEPIVSPPAVNPQQELVMDLPNFGRNLLAQNFGEGYLPRNTQFLQPGQSQPQPQQSQQLMPVQPQPLQTFQQQQLQLHQKNSWISIDSSLTKLFQCMSLAYRQKLTSPKWNRFKGVRLRWKDKIRLNNVIWRCWHMQFIMKKKTMVCQFASPLDVDTHNKPEAVVMEGKYWKRKLSTVAAEYKKWRLFYRNRIMGWNHKDSTPDLHPVSLDGFDWNRPGTFGGGPANMMFDDDLLMDFTDILFSSLSSNQPFAFPNPREIARAGMVADFIQPGLIQLQPNLEDFMDTLEPLQDYVNSKLLPPVPEELENFATPDNLLPEVIPALMPKEPKASTSSGSSVQQQVQGAGTSTGNVIVTGARDGTNDISRPMEAITSFSTRTIQSEPPSESNFFQIDSIGDPSPTHGAASTPCTNVTASEVVMPQAQHTSSSSSATVTALLQQDSPAMAHHRAQNQSPSNGPSSRSSFANRADVFTKPAGKPRSGRSRSGPSSSGRSAGSSVAQASSPGAAATVTCPVPSPPQPIAQQSPQPMNTSTLSNTLLSHLLTTSGAPSVTATVSNTAASSYSNNVIEKMVGVQVIPSTTSSQLMSNNNPVNMMMATPDIHQQSQQLLAAQQQQQASTLNQPWNPKNANETLNPNMPINFGMSKPILLGQSSPQPSVDEIINLTPVASTSGGNISPPLLANTPSPPMGPPYSGPGSPVKPFRPKSDTERVQYKEHRRVCHINAEQKRRCNIKNGFDTLHALIPQLNQNPNAKAGQVSKAAMLQKGAEYIRQLKLERAQLKEEIETHRQEVEALNAAINNCQSMLPATGAPVSRQRTNKMTEMFDQWVRIRTTENWKFWIFSILIRPLLDSYNNSVSTASVDELCRTVLAWVDQHCSLVDLRPVVLNSLRYLCTTTDILTNPANLSEEAYRSINRSSRDNSDRDPTR